ncbi:unnamed protein product [Caenorhabditis brenneri]
MCKRSTLRLIRSWRRFSEKVVPQEIRFEPLPITKGGRYVYFFKVNTSTGCSLVENMIESRKWHELFNIESINSDDQQPFMWHALPMNSIIEATFLSQRFKLRQHNDPDLKTDLNEQLMDKHHLGHVLSDVSMTDQVTAGLNRIGKAIFQKRIKPLALLYDYQKNPEHSQSAQKTQFEQNYSSAHDPVTNNHGNSSNEDKLEMPTSVNFGQQLHTILEKKNCSNCNIEVRNGNACSACYKYKYRHGIERPVKVHTREIRGAGVCTNCGAEAVKDECFKCHTYKTRYNKPRPKRLWKKKVATSECNNCGIPTTRASCQACYKYKRLYGIDRPEGY